MVSNRTDKNVYITHNGNQIYRVISHDFIGRTIDETPKINVN